MKKIVVLVIVLLIVTFAVRMSEAGQVSPSVAALDPQTFVMTDGRIFYLFGIEDGKLVLKDSVFVYTAHDGGFSAPRLDAEKTVLKHLKLEKR